MFSLRGSRKRKTEEIIKKFLRSYAENEKRQDKKDLKTWLIFELQNELPNKKVEDIEKILGPKARPADYIDEETENKISKGDIKEVNPSDEEKK